MTTEQRQAAILRHMGWFLTCPHTADTGIGELCTGRGLYTDGGKIIAWPSLDALALVEASLSDEVRMNYSSNLSRVLLATYQENSWLISATFPQRLHALCLTLGLEEQS